MNLVRIFLAFFVFKICCMAEMGNVEKIPERRTSSVQESDLETSKSPFDDIKTKISQIFKPSPKSSASLTSEAPPSRPLEIGALDTLNDRINTIQKLLTDPARNEAAIKDQFDRIGLDIIQNPLRLATLEQLSQAYDDATKARQSLNALEEKVAAYEPLKESFEATRDVLRIRAVDLADNATKKELTKAQDALGGNYNKQSAEWGTSLSDMRSFVNFMEKNFNKRSAVTNSNIKTISTNLTNITDKVTELNKRLEDIDKIGEPEIAAWQNFVQSDLFKQQNIEKLTPNLLQSLLNDLKFAQRFLTNYAKLDALRHSLQDEITAIIELINASILTLNVSYIVKSPYTSLFEQFDAQAKKDFEQGDSKGYFLGATIKKWVPQSLKFSTYNDMIAASPQELDKRYNDAIKRRDAALAAKDAGTITEQALASALTDFNVARELQRELRNPFAREIFIAYLQAEGLFDDVPKGPKGINKLALSQTTIDSLNTILPQIGNLSSQATRLTRTREDTIKTILGEIENKIAFTQGVLKAQPAH